MGCSGSKEEEGGSVMLTLKGRRKIKEEEPAVMRGVVLNKNSGSSVVTSSDVGGGCTNNITLAQQQQRGEVVAEDPHLRPSSYITPEGGSKEGHHSRQCPLFLPSQATSTVGTTSPESMMIDSSPLLLSGLVLLVEEQDVLDESVETDKRREDGKKQEEANTIIPSAPLLWVVPPVASSPLLPLGFFSSSSSECELCPSSSLFPILSLHSDYCCTTTVSTVSLSDEERGLKGGDSSAVVRRSGAQLQIQPPSAAITSTIHTKKKNVKDYSCFVGRGIGCPRANEHLNLDWWKEVKEVNPPVRLQYDARLLVDQRRLTQKLYMYIREWVDESSLEDERAFLF